MVQLEPLLRLAGSIAADLIRSSGTTVSTRRPTADASQLAGTVDLETLAVAPVVDAAPVLPAEPAIVIPLAAMATADVAELAMRAPVRDTDYAVLLLPSVTDVRSLDVVRVDACLDARLVGAEMVVYAVEGSTAGAVRRVLCRPGVLGVPGAHP